MFERKSNEEWKSYLREDAKHLLSEILEATKLHRHAYTTAKNVEIAQIWCALIELKKEIEDLKEELRKIAEPFRKIIEIGEAEKRKAIERVISGLMEEKKEEKTKEVVESLMKL